MNFIKIFLSVLLLSCFLSNAQNKGNFEYGFAVGPSLTSVTTFFDQQADPSFNFHARISGEYYFSDTWAMRAEVYYDNKGFADGFVQDSNSNRIETDFNLTYITIPLKAGLHFGNNGNFYINLGPYVGFLINAEDSETSTDRKEFFRSTDFGFASGIGYMFDLSEKMRLSVEFNRQSGVLDIFENNPGNASRNTKTALSIGLVF
mgnify:CR=1 FL=1